MELDANDLMLFAHVAEAGSFSRAAEQVGLPKSTVSRHRRAGLKSWRRRSPPALQHAQAGPLTEFGLGIFEHARRLQEEAQAALAFAQHRQVTPRTTPAHQYATGIFDKLILSTFFYPVLCKLPGGETGNRSFAAPRRPALRTVRPRHPHRPQPTRRRYARRTPPRRYAKCTLRQPCLPQSLWPTTNARRIAQAHRAAPAWQQWRTPHIGACNTMPKSGKVLPDGPGRQCRRPDYAIDITRTRISVLPSASPSPQWRRDIWNAYCPNGPAALASVVEQCRQRS